MLKKFFKPFRFTRKRKDSDNPTVLDAHEHRLSSADFSRNSANVAVRLQHAGFQAYLVGGCVRDSLLGVTPKDFDVATNATPEQVRHEFRNSRIIGRRFKLAHVHFGREIIEVATFRSDHSQSDDDNNDHSAHDASGRILRDNVYGNMEEDAQRRDFTMNALYYDVSNEKVYDYSTGFADIKRRLIRLIGDPEQRYLEDPVRMLRAVRFAAKLDFTIEPSTAEPIRRLAHLLRDIPAARLYEEVLKLFLSGYAERTYELLCEYDLFAQLFPGTAKALLKQPAYVDRLLRNAFKNTDKRIANDRPVTPAFLFAALLWPVLTQRSQSLQHDGMHPIPAAQEAAHQVLLEQVLRVAVPKRFSIPTREIWDLQERLPRRAGKRADTLLAHPRFRAAYDFLLLRESAGEDTEGLGQWWTEYQDASDSQRRAMIGALSSSGAKPRSKRRRKPRTSKPLHAQQDQL
ncbi:MAG: polynucleotide adenylyltransferase PcnB [Gammaproteobacteria bacterium]|nr:polynucleotide adenylyltransferase PcnB [Gammaproteobacteria bacterium]